MTCKELHEEITAFVDNRVDEEEYRKKVREHITFCSDCRAAYERELATKIAARDRSGRAGAPDMLRAAILDDVDRAAEERRQEAERRQRAIHGDPTWLDSFFARYFSPIGVVAALLLVIGGSAVLYMQSEDRPKLAHAPEGPIQQAPANGAAAVPENFFNKASNNFQAIEAGKLGLQVETSDPAELKSYFSSHGVGYPVVFTPVKAELAGGVVSNHGRRNFAHLVFAEGKTLLYIFEVPYDALAAGDVVYVTPDVLKRLDGGEVIWEEPAGSQLAMFKQDGVVLAAVSNASRPEMRQLMALK